MIVTRPMDVHLCLVYAGLFLVLVSITSGQREGSCKNNTECVPLRNCPELYANYRDNPIIKKLVDRLRCKTKRNQNEDLICCPTYYNKDAIVFQDDHDTLDKTTLLPNSSFCGVQNTDRIVGGVETELDEHPWMALLHYQKPKGSGFYCGGVLISSRYVLTAAHCVKGADLPKDWNLTQVRLGEYNMSSEIDCVDGDCAEPAMDVPVEQIIAHPNYLAGKQGQQFDIALLRLKHEVKFNYFVKPICLPLNEEFRLKSYEGYTMEVAGWGKTERRSSSPVKLKVRLPIVSNMECGEIYATVGRIITRSQMCAGGLDGSDSCRGDSGGPLMGQDTKKNIWFALGVVSYGPSPCGSQGWPGVYTRVTAYMDWILETIQP